MLCCVFIVYFFFVFAPHSYSYNPPLNVSPRLLTWRSTPSIDCGRACRFELELQTSFSGSKLVSIGANSSGSVQFLRFGVAGSSGSLRPVRRSVWPVRRLVWPVRPVSAGSSGSVRPVRRSVRPVWPVSTAFPSSVRATETSGS